MRRAVFVSALIILLSLSQIRASEAWSNGGYSADTSTPDYGTHDWIAQHALDWLPAEKKQYITDNLATYLYGTELPDLPKTQGGIGDASSTHHIYYRSTGVLQDGAAATRADEEYQVALTYLQSGNYAEAAKHAGAMTHYISDMAVFGHVMGAPTDWGTEIHHSEYEDHVTAITKTYSATYIKPLQFDGVLITLTAGEAARQLALDTTLDGGATYTAKWMDQNYDWASTTFTTHSWESINLAVNKVADTLSTLYDAYTPPKTQTTITCTASKTTANENEQFIISGIISADVSATVIIYQNTGGNWATLAVVASIHGAYSAPIALKTGSYAIKAAWTGDSTHEGATSTESTITVQPRTGNVKVTIVDEKDSLIPGATVKTITTPTEQTSLEGTTSTDGTATFGNIRVGSYAFNASKTGYKANTGTGQAVEDQTNTIKIVLTRNNAGVPGYPSEAVLVGLILIIGYFILFKTNLKILNKSNIN